tara:strand:- start:1224 stop:3242 length:2019 start_codon:yes stop_codon:yes gene_type:complete
MAKKIDELVVEIRAETKDLRRGLGNLNKQLDKTNKTTRASVVTFGNLAKVFAAVGVVKLVQGVVKTTRTFEDLIATIQANTGSIEETNKAFEDILSFTSTTTFTIEQVTKAFIEFRRLGLSMTREQMKGIGNVAAANNVSIDQMAQAIFRASTTSMESLMAMGFTGQMAGDMITLRFGEKGVAGTIEKTMKKNTGNVLDFVKEVGDAKFGTALEDRLATLSGKLINLDDNVDIFRRQIGEAGLKKALIDLALTFQTVVTSASGEGGLADLLGRILGGAINILNKAMIVLHENTGKVKLALMGLAAMLTVMAVAKVATSLAAGYAILAASFVKVMKAAKLLRKEMLALMIVAMLNPVGALAVGLTAVTVGTGIAVFKDEIGTQLNNVIADIDDAIELAMSRKSPDPSPLGDPLKNVPTKNVIPEYVPLVKNLTSLRDLLKDQKFELEMLTEAQAILNEQLSEGNISLEEAKALWREMLEQSGPMGKAMVQIAEEVEQLSGSFSDELVDALMAGENALESFKNFALNVVQAVISAFMEMMVIQPIVEAILGAFSMTMPQGGVASSGGGGGGVGVNASGGAMQAGTPYLVGERGAELFIPHSGGSLMNNMNTRNAMGGQNIVVNQSLNFSTGVVPTVRTEVTKMLPQIAEMTKASVFEAATRGGQFRKAMQGGVG